MCPKKYDIWTYQVISCPTSGRKVVPNPPWWALVPNPVPNPVFLCFFNIKWIICPKKYDIWTYHMISWANFNIMGGFGTFWIISVSMTHRPPGKNFFGIWDSKNDTEIGKTILSNFCSGAAIVIFFRLAANQDFVPNYLGAKLWFAGKRTKISVAAPAQKLLRIVFPTYMFFSGSQIQKSIFSGASAWNFSTNVKN